MLIRNLRCLFSNVKLTFNEQYPNTAVLSLTNTAKRNALSSTTLKQLQDNLMEIHKECSTGNTRAMVLKAQEGSVFSAGHDLKQIKNSKAPQQIFAQSASITKLINTLPIPSICSIDGQAVAAGLQLALSCDIVLATKRSLFSTPGVKFGLFCSTPAVQLVRSINSLKKANQMLLFGEPITSEEALHYGLINQVVADQHQLHRAVAAYIQKTLSLSRQVLSLGKRVLHQQIREQKDAAYCIAVQGMKTNVLELADCSEGLNAFAEKRKPSFKN